jgi:ATP-dependent 26S proteasome regulatory subunit
MDIAIANLPDFSNEADKAIFVSRVSNAVNDMLMEKYKIAKPNTKIALADKKTTVNTVPQNSTVKDGEKDESGEENTPITLRDPQFTFDQLVLEDAVMEELHYSIKFESVKYKVYEEWGLKKIDPSPKLALNFHGPSGTGKTMAAQAIAHVMGKKIILASYAEIESKYHGDGPKNVKKLFNFALENNAVLFIDEADSLLSKRLTNVTQGSEQAINSMRSQLLIQIEQFSGIVIFATNLAENYDGAFVTRIKSIHFKKPNQDMRKALWKKMLLDTLPLDSQINAEQLSEIDDICGRDIKNAVVKAAIKVAIDGDTAITQKTLEDSIHAIIESNKEIKSEPKGNLTDAEKKDIGHKIKLQLKKDKIRRKLYRRV